jgi:error-prone DNA polymerase
VIVEHLLDDTELLKTLGHRKRLSPSPPDRGDEGIRGPDPRGAVPVKKVREIYIPDLHINRLSVKARNIR